MEDNRTKSQPLTQALEKPNGARFYRCALQVNPFAYQGRYSKQTAFNNEADYNVAIIAACQKEQKSKLLLLPIITVSAIPKTWLYPLGKPEFLFSEVLRRHQRTGFIFFVCMT